MKNSCSMFNSRFVKHNSKYKENKNTQNYLETHPISGSTSPT